MKAEAEIKVAGMPALIATLGLVETERFLAAVSRNEFDNAQWRRSDLPEMDLRTLAREPNKLMPDFMGLPCLQIASPKKSDGETIKPQRR